MTQKKIYKPKNQTIKTNGNNQPNTNNHHFIINGDNHHFISHPFRKKIINIKKLIL
jgi:hypothetical protein